MQYETKRRSILKAVSWRSWATVTTAVLVFIFTGKFALAITIGFLEVFAKMALYFFHERLWQKIRYGKKEVPSFVLWFTGLPASGKKDLANRVFDKLKEMNLKTERIDSKDVRPLFPETGFSDDDISQHVKRCGHLCAMLEKNGVIVVATFVAPYAESRRFVREVSNNFVEVYMNTTVEACEARDTKGRYVKARSGEYKHFPGVDAPYDVPENAEIVIDVDQVSMQEAADQVVEYLRKSILNN